MGISLLASYVTHDWEEADGPSKDMKGVAEWVAGWSSVGWFHGKKVIYVEWIIAYVGRKIDYE